MSKKMRLNLGNLQVQSFVTSLNRDEKGNVVGGEDSDCGTCVVNTCFCTDWVCGNTQRPTGNPCKVCD
jgi:hypothetical protein